MSLSDVELQRALTSVSYKPGWRLTIRELPHQGPYLSVIVDLPNSYDPSSTVPLRIHSPIPPMRTPASFYEWLTWRLIVIETHEALEWLRVDGSPWHDPHAGLD